jgi:catechol 2,3-dioxygenase-like lactoylglutathione lyase family enzyme
MAVGGLDHVVIGALDHLRSNGVEPELGPIERHGAAGVGVSVYFRDPDGSLLEFISYDA